MIILSIETSCDETAVSVVEADDAFPKATYTVRGNALFSQIDIHREYGGVFPSLAKREHARTIVPMLEKALEEAGLETTSLTLKDHVATDISTLLSREEELAEKLFQFSQSYGKPSVDLIAVTNGPGLEPALWVGVNFAQALGKLWDIPVVPVNHMEGHVLASVFDGTKLADIVFPALAVLISGGHTELVRMDDWHTYTKISETRDDAVGEAFDKVARLMRLPYPGGPEISKLAEAARKKDLPAYTEFPRPMLGSDNLDFSFSGLKTAVRYAIVGKKLTEDEKAAVAREFEDAVTEVLIHKTKKAIDSHSIESVILGGGVSANSHIRNAFSNLTTLPDYTHILIHLPDRKLSTDNAVMIALAGHAHTTEKNHEPNIRATGNLSLGE